MYVLFNFHLKRNNCAQKSNMHLLFNNLSIQIEGNSVNLYKLAQNSKCYFAKIIYRFYPVVIKFFVRYQKKHRIQQQLTISWFTKKFCGINGP